MTGLGGRSSRTRWRSRSMCASRAFARAAIADVACVHGRPQLRALKPHSHSSAVHFVTHGYGALVLRRALACLDWSSVPSLAVMIAPTNRGVSCEAMRAWAVPSVFGVPVSELVHLSAHEWDARVPQLPRSVHALVVAGTCGWNPLLSGSHDGRVCVEDTRLLDEHVFVTVGCPHGLLLYHPRTLALTANYLRGRWHRLPPRGLP